MKLSRQYIAGFFDGEGCVNMGRCRKSIYPRVLIVNTDRSILEALQAQYGGDIHPVCHRRAHWKLSWTWRLSWTPAVNFLCDIEPWLIVKRDQAMTAIAWDAARPSRYGHDTWDQPTLELLVARMKWLNHKGPRIGEDPIEPVLREIQANAGAGAAPL